MDPNRPSILAKVYAKFTPKKNISEPPFITKPVETPETAPEKGLESNNAGQKRTGDTLASPNQKRIKEGEETPKELKLPSNVPSKLLNPPQNPPIPTMQEDDAPKQLNLSSELTPSSTPSEKDLEPLDKKGLRRMLYVDISTLSQSKLENLLERIKIEGLGYNIKTSTRASTKDLLKKPLKVSLIKVNVEFFQRLARISDINVNSGVQPMNVSFLLQTSNLDVLEDFAKGEGWVGGDSAVNSAIKQSLLIFISFSAMSSKEIDALLFKLFSLPGEKMPDDASKGNSNWSKKLRILKNQLIVIKSCSDVGLYPQQVYCLIEGKIDHALKGIKSFKSLQPDDETSQLIRVLLLSAPDKTVVDGNEDRWALVLKNEIIRNYHHFYVGYE